MLKHYALSCLLVLSSGALAFEPAPAVKASVVLKTSTSWDGAPLSYPTGQAEITGMIVEVAIGGQTGWHTHPVPNFGMLLEGEFEVQLKNGTTKRLKAGDAVAEVVNTLHNGRNVGTVPVKILVFYAGAVESGKLTVKESAP